MRADGSRARRAGQMLEDKLGIDSGGITTNEWRESEWCLFPDENVEDIAELISDSEFSDLSVVKTGFAIHLMEPHLSKGEGLSIALEKMNIDPIDVLAIGDAPNDISMFKFVGHSVAVGGCFEELAAVSKVISPHPHGETFPPLVDAILGTNSDN